jgi:segregation and condensation protein A
VKSRPQYEIGKETVSVPEMIEYLRRQLSNLHKDSLSATQLFEKQHGPRAMICLFLAILELVKRQAVELTQGEAFGDIGLRRGSGFDEEKTVADLAAVEEEYH